MKKSLLIVPVMVSIFVFFSFNILHAQNIGMGTTTPHPTALLHIDLGTSTVKGFLVNGTYNGTSTVPDLGAGSRMMFYPGKAAFRAGYINNTQWDNTNVGRYSIAMGFTILS